MTANDSDVSDGEILTGSQVVRVYGENLTAPFVTLTFGGVEYTSLYQGEGYIEFVITDNGTALIAVDGNQFMSFEVDGITIPSSLEGTVIATQTPGLSATGGINQESSNNRCLQYRHVVSESYPYFRVVVVLDEGYTVSENDFTGLNGTVQSVFINPETMRATMFLQPADITQPSCILVDGFILFVGNYTTE